MAGRGSNMNKRELIALCVLSLLLMPRPVIAQECHDQSRLSTQQLLEYLRHARVDVPPNCIDDAFHRIATADRKIAVPALISLLDYQRPRISTSDGAIIAIRPNDALNRFPATYELYKLGQDAEPSLFSVISQTPPPDDVARHNATYTLMLIHRREQPALVRKLKEMSMAIRGSSAANREIANQVETEAVYASNLCSPEERRTCEKALAANSTTAK